MTRSLSSPPVLARLLRIGLGSAALASVGAALWILAPAAVAVIEAPSAYREFKARYDQVRCLNDRRAFGGVYDVPTAPYDPRRVTYDMPRAGCPGPLAKASLADIAQVLSEGPPPRRRDIFLQQIRARLAVIGAEETVDAMQALLDTSMGGNVTDDSEGYAPYD